MTVGMLVLIYTLVLLVLLLDFPEGCERDGYLMIASSPIIVRAD